MKRKLSLSFIGAGKLASFLAPALHSAGHDITEIVARNTPGSMKRARTLARRVKARAVYVEQADLHADIIWLTVPDSEIRAVAAAVTKRLPATRKKQSGGRRDESGSPPLPFPRFAFHSSGALGSDDLRDLRKLGLAVGSIHPLMTFVSGASPSLVGVPFALEGDASAIKAAQAIVRDLGGNSSRLAARHKSAYHTWATMTSPLLLAYLATLEEAARAAGIEREDARRMSLPIVGQTLANYSRLGLAKSFTGPFVRGDVQTVESHLALLKRDRQSRAVYLALAAAALKHLPVKNRKQFSRLLNSHPKD